MQQASRIAILGLLALMQLFAPLVHAHAGGGQFPGMIHLPGLEFLSKPNGTAAQPPASPAESRDVIVGLAPGLKNQGNHTIPAPDPKCLRPVPFSPAAIPPQRLEGFIPSPPCFLPPTLWLAPAPRAPPARV